MSETETESTETETNQNYGGLITGLISYSIQIIISFVLVGSIGLYISKIAEANILPDNILFVPFGEKQKKIEDIPIDINVIKIYNNMGLGMFLGQKPIKVESTKIIFNEKEVLSKYENGLLGLIDSFKSNPERANYFGLYMNNVINPIIANNNWIINKIFSFMYQYLSESVIIILFPIFAFIFLILMYLLNMILCFFYQIKNWSDFFMIKNIKNNNVSWNKPFSYFMPWRWFFFILYCFFLFFPIVSFLPMLISFYTIFSPLSISGKVENSNIKIGFLTFMKNVILYKSQLYLILFSIGLLIQSAKNLGSSGFIGCVIGILIAIFSFHIYNQVIPKNNKFETSGLASNNQNSMKGGKKKQRNK